MQAPDEITPSGTTPDASNRRVGRTTWIVIIASTAALAYVSVEFGVRAHELRLRIDSCRKLAELGVLMHESRTEGRAIAPDWLEQLAVRGDDRAIDPRSGKLFIVSRIDGPTTQFAKLDEIPVSARAPLSRSPYVSLIFGNEEGGSVLFADGHVEWLLRDEYERAVEGSMRQASTLPSGE